MLGWDCFASVCHGTAFTTALFHLMDAAKLNSGGTKTEHTALLKNGHTALGMPWNSWKTLTDRKWGPAQA